MLYSACRSQDAELDRLSRYATIPMCNLMSRRIKRWYSAKRREGEELFLRAKVVHQNKIEGASSKLQSPFLLFSQNATFKLFILLTALAAIHFGNLIILEIKSSTVRFLHQYSKTFETASAIFDIYDRLSSQSVNPIV